MNVCRKWIWCATVVNHSLLTFWRLSQRDAGPLNCHRLDFPRREFRPSRLFQFWFWVFLIIIKRVDDGDSWAGDHIDVVKFGPAALFDRIGKPGSILASHDDGAIIWLGQRLHAVIGGLFIVYVLGLQDLALKRKLTNYLFIFSGDRWFCWSPKRRIITIVTLLTDREIAAVFGNILSFNASISRNLILTISLHNMMFHKLWRCILRLIQRRFGIVGKWPSFLLILFRNPFCFFEESLERVDEILFVPALFEAFEHHHDFAVFVLELVGDPFELLVIEVRLVVEEHLGVRVSLLLFLRGKNVKSITILEVVKAYFSMGRPLLCLAFILVYSITLTLIHDLIGLLQTFRIFLKLILQSLIVFVSGSKCL